MNQVSRPMQIALAAVLVFAVVWFAVLRPTDPAEDVAATPVTPAASTPRSDVGGAEAESALGKTVEKARTDAAGADAAVKDRESQTGEESATPAPAAATPAPDAAAPTTGTTPAGTTPAAKADADATAAKTAKKSGASSAQDRADEVIEDITADLAKRRAVVVLVWSKRGKEDRIMHRRVTRQIDERKGKVKVYLVPVGQVGRYDGLLSGLSLGQIPSTVVIAPNNEAKVLGGLASTARIDRLTSSATLIKPVAAKK